MTRSVLAITSELPWPLNAGGHLRTYHLLREIAQAFPVRLIAGITRDQSADADALRAAGIDVRPVLLPARNRATEAVRALRAAASAEPYVLYRRHDRSPMHDAVRRAVAAERPGVLYFDHLDSFLFARHAAGLPIVIDLHNVYSLLVRREAADTSRNQLVRRYLAREAVLLERVEAAAVRRANVVFAVSREEQQHFAQLRGGEAHLIPNGVDCARYAALPTGRASSPPNILFIGTLSWPANQSAALALGTDVLARVQQTCPDASLTIVGRDPSPEVRALAANPRITVAGSVPDIIPYLSDARLLAVPLEVGGGTRLKILEAFAAGLPVVSTPIGAEGIAAAHDRDLFVAEGRGLTDAVLTLLTDPGRGDSLAHHARILARDVYDWPVIGRTARAAIAPVLE